MQVAQEEESALRRAETSQRVGHLKRVLVVLTVVQNSGEPRHVDQLVSEQLPPEGLHRRQLCKESMPADIETKPLVLDRASEPPPVLSASSTVT